jgi:hypothetical protein
LIKEAQEEYNRVVSAPIKETPMRTGIFPLDVPYEKAKIYPDLFDLEPL